ncbi:MAG: S8 family peptidase, partial [Ilumatobacteraceae bacterium]
MSPIESTVRSIRWWTRVVVAACIGLIGSTSVSSAAAEGASRAAVPAEQRTAIDPGLEREAAERGRVRVIVLFDTPVRPELELPERELTAQRAAVAADRAVVSRALQGTGSEVTRQFQYVPGLVASVTPQGLEALSRSAAVSSVEREKVVFPLLAESTVKVEADQMWTSGTGYRGTGQTIAILDSGIDADHPVLQRVGSGGSFSSRVIAGACFSTIDGSQGVSTLCPNGETRQTGVEAAWDCGLVPGCYHGTHVAGIAAGRANASTSAGVAPDANLISVQVFSKRTQGCPNDAAECIGATEGDLVAGLDYVYGLRTTYEIAAVNMSLGGGLYTASCTTALSPIIANLKAADIATVIATGNGDDDGGRIGVGFPACDPNAVAVSATTDNDLVTDFADTHSTLVDLYAPGKDIYSAMPVGTDGGDYASLSGTSMAAPHVAGAWALLRQAIGTQDDHGVDNLLALLQETGTAVQTREGPTDLEFSRPRINIKQAFDAFEADRVPGAPTGVSGVRGDGQVTVSWSAPVDLGHPELTGYTVTA